MDISGMDVVGNFFWFCLQAIGLAYILDNGLSLILTFFIGTFCRFVLLKKLKNNSYKRIRGGLVRVKPLKNHTCIFFRRSYPCLSLIGCFKKLLSVEEVREMKSGRKVDLFSSLSSLIMIAAILLYKLHIESMYFLRLIKKFTKRDVLGEEIEKIMYVLEKGVLWNLLGAIYLTLRFLGMLSLGAYIFAKLSEGTGDLVFGDMFLTCLAGINFKHYFIESLLRWYVFTSYSLLVLWGLLTLAMYIELKVTASGMLDGVFVRRERKRNYRVDKNLPLYLNIKRNYRKTK